jgi:hypothetical protein
VEPAKNAAQTQQQLQAAEEQEKILREAARTRWAQALDPRWQAQAGLLDAGRVWGTAAAFADFDPQAAAALRKAEERMRALHPYAMARYDRLRNEGARPLEAMQNAFYLFARDPHARPGQPAAPRPGIEPGTSDTRPRAHAGSDSSTGTPEPSPQPDLDQGALQRGQQIAAQLQARALAERGSRLSPDELATALEASTTLPAEVIARLARAQNEVNTAARAEGARAADLDRADAAASAPSSGSGPAEARRDTATAGTAGANASADRTAAQLAAESFPRTAADGIRAAVSGSLRQSAAARPAPPPPRRPGATASFRDILATEADMNELAQSPLFWGALIIGLLAVYLLPSWIGIFRQVEGLGWLIAFNVLCPGVGWLGGMILACTLPRREPQVVYLPTVYYTQQPRQYW